VTDHRGNGRSRPGSSSDVPVHRARRGETRQIRDRWDPPERSGAIKGIVLLVVVVVVGILLIPSATRPPLAVASSRTPPTTAVASPPSHSRHPTSHSKGPSTTPASSVPAPSTIEVLVANATSVNGVAGAITTFLGGKGFATLSAVNALTALSSSQIYATSTGTSAEAAEVASDLGLTSAAIQPAASTAPVSSAGNAQVVVIAGQDLAARFAPSTTPTTTGS